MPCVPIDSGRPSDPSFHKLGSAVEALQNILYLLDMQLDDPQKARDLIRLSAIPMALLKEFYFEQHGKCPDRLGQLCRSPREGDG